MGNRSRWLRRSPIPAWNAWVSSSIENVLVRRIDEVFAALDLRERQVLRMRYGLQGQSPLGLSDIGKVLGVSKERIRQIEESAMSKLRQPQHAVRFVQFLQEQPERLVSAAVALRRCL